MHRPLLVVALLSGCGASTISDSQAAALVSVYDSTAGSGWVNSSGWQNADKSGSSYTTTACDWFMVTCSAAAVSDLALGSNLLTGTIPDLSALTGLGSLGMGNNSLSGTLPASLSAMEALSSLTVVANSISGTLPAALASLTRIESFQLDSNSVSGSIPDMSQLTSLVDFSMPNNKISGSLPNSIASVTRLRYLVLWHNALSGTVPDGLSSLTELEYLTFAQNKFSGSLPGIDKLSALTTIMVDRNSLSGTLPAMPSPGTNVLELALLLENRLSGSIPTQLSSLTKLNYLLLGNNRLSGTLTEDWQTTSLVVLALDSNSLSGSLPNLASFSSLKVVDMSSNSLSGTLRALPTVLTDINLSRNRLSGTLMQALPSTITSVILNDMYLSGTLPSFGHSLLQTVALSRNYLVGRTDVLEGSWNLTTLLLNSNYLSCDVADLENSTKLGEGKFQDPVPAASMSAVSALQAQYELVVTSTGDVGTFDNTVLAFAGNSEMTTSAGYIPPSAPGRTTRADEIQQGRYGMFSGFSAFKQLIYVTIPLLLLLHGVVVAVSIRGSTRQDATIRGYFFPSRPEARRAAMLSRVFYALVAPLLALAGLGVLLGLLNVLTDSVFGDHGCVDPLVRASIASPRTSTAYQWMFVCGDIACLVVSRIGIRQIQRWNEEPRTRRVHTWLAALAADDDPLPQRLLAVWQGNAGCIPAFTPDGHGPLQKPPLCRRVAFWCMHVPLICVASIPAIGYVLSENVPAESGWWYSVFGNTLVVAFIKVGFTSSIVPNLGRRLSKYRLSAATEPLATSSSAIGFFKTQVRTMLIVSLSTVLVAPMMAVLILDEACLRYYLFFAPSLSDLLESWGIGQRGAEAYRLQFCSRRLVVEFQVVWLSLVVIGALVQPSVRLLMALPKIRSLSLEMASGGLKSTSARLCCRSDEESKKDLYFATLEHCHLLLKELSDLLAHVVTVMVFGIAAPSLLLLGPLVAWLNLCSVRWITTELSTREADLRCSMERIPEFAKDISEREDDVDHGVYSKCWGWFGPEFGGRILVHPPTKLLLTALHVGNAAVSVLIFLDLEFGVAPMAVYGGLHLAVLAAPQASSAVLYTQRGGTRGVQLNVELDGEHFDIGSKVEEDSWRVPDLIDSSGLAIGGCDNNEEELVPEMEQHESQERCMRCC